MSLRGRLNALPRWQRVALGFALATLVYAAAGFFAAPALVRNQTISVFSETFGRMVRVGEVRVNPFLLTLDVEKFELPDRDGSAFVRFDSLHVDFELSSIWHRAFTFGEIRLVAPFVHVKILPDGALNFGDMLEILIEEDAEAASPVEDAGPPPLLVFLTRIDEGRIVFSDLSRPTHFEHEITPLNVELRDFGTRPDDNSPYSFKATTGAGEALEWEGSISVVPFHSTGRFGLTGVRPRTGWLYVQDDVLFEVVDGSIDVEGRYDLDAREGLVLRLEDGAIRVRDFAVADRESGEVALAIGEFDIEGITAAYPEQTVHVDALTTRKGRHHALRLEDGSFRIAQLFQAGSEPAPATSEAAGGEIEAAGGEAEAAPTWAATVDRVRIEEHVIDFEDRSTEPHAALSIGPISLALDGVSSDLTRRIPVDLEIAFAEAGRLHLSGPVRIEPLEAELEIDLGAFDLRPFQPYWLPTLAADLRSGSLGVTGDLELRVENGEEADLRFAGDVRLDALELVDRSLGSKLASSSAVELAGIEFATTPTSLSVDRLVLREPKALVLVAPDGTTNLTDLVVADESPEAGSEATASPMVPVRIGSIEVVGGTTDFEDRSIEPRFRTGISRLNGKIVGLSSAADARATVAMTGLIGGSTPIAIDGVVSPLAEETYVDLALSFQNFELAALTPYSGRHIGQTISRGKLFLDVEYVLDGHTITGENRVFLDQFTLGDRVDSPDALNLPIGLAVALIKDRNGEIHIDLPVRGDVDDPEFSVAGLIFGALGNLITKIALSPFAMLGGLGGGADGEEMKTVSFRAGSVVLEPSEKSQLDALAAALIDRPGLALEITGRAALERDGPALQAAALDLDLRRARLLELQSKWFGDKPTSIDEVVLEEEDRRRLLHSRYEAVFGAKPRTMLVPMLEIDPASPLGQAEPARQEAAWEAELERRVAADIPVSEGDLRQLAQARSEAIRDEMVGTGGISAERIFVLDVEVVEARAGDVPSSELSLTAH